MRIAPAIAVVLLLAAGLAAQSPRAGAGVIAGTLVTADSGSPVRRARVVLGGTSITTSTVSDESGGFSFTGLPAGVYAMSAVKAGYLPGRYGEKTPGLGRAGTSISLADGQRLDRLTFVMARAGAINGMVIDDLGDPASGTSVRAMRYVVQNGRRTLIVAGTGAADDRGVYRIPALPPGDYIVAAMSAGLHERPVTSNLALQGEMAVLRLQAQIAAAGGEARRPPGTSLQPEPDPGPVTGYVPVYFPGTTNFAAASMVALGVSEDRTGLDLQLQLVPMARVSGTVLDVDGSVPHAEVNLGATGAGGALASAGLPAFNVTLEPDGRFAFDGVQPGQYTLIASSRRSRSASGAAVDARWAMQELTVNGADVADVTLTLQRGMAVSGVVTFDGPAQPAVSAHMGVMFTPVGESHGLAELVGPEMAPVNDELRFTATDLVPGRYHVTPTPIPSGWTLASAIFGGRDVLDVPLEIKPGETPPPGVLTLTRRQTELSGTLFDRTGAPTSALTVIVFAADSRYWTPDSLRILSMRPAASGRFSFKNLPPGTYRLAAATDVDSGDWLDPAFLRELAAGAIPVTIAEGEKKTQDVRIK